VFEHSSKLDTVLEPGRLTVHLQPVLDVQTPRPHPHYFEALIRGPRGTPLEAPAILFEHARKENREALVDRACASAIFSPALRLPEDATLGFNVHASTLAMDTGFVDFLAGLLDALRVPARRLVVEVLEHAPPQDLESFRASLKKLRALGARIALDDVGLGNSNYMMVLECRPDYLKVDRYFVAGCHGDFHRKAVLASIAQLARPFGARVVAEGVEQPEELAVLKRLGITLVQGYLFGRPAPAERLDGSPRIVSARTRGGRRFRLGLPGREAVARSALGRS
jgi:EAL domain-containing protein (putative c-di-GMP-specific phosphodiesterase class I)